MKDAKGHGSNPRGGPTSPRAERVKLNRQLDERKTAPPSTRPWGPARPEPKASVPETIMAGLRKQFGDKAPSEDRVRQIMAAAAQSGAHTLGVHSIDPSLTLAETSARGATTASVKQGS
jgi:hypothetical protein